jgi:hypothetical protein
MKQQSNYLDAFRTASKAVIKAIPETFNVNLRAEEHHWVTTLSISTRDHHGIDELSLSVEDNTGAFSLRRADGELTVRVKAFEPNTPPEEVVEAVRVYLILKINRLISSRQRVIQSFQNSVEKVYWSNK